MRQLKYGAFLLALAALVSCAQLGLAPAQSFNQQLAYAYGANTAALQAATSSLDAGGITSSDMEKVIDLHGQVRTLLDAAKATAATGDITTAQSKLALALTALTELQGYLRTHNVGG
jgi:hypothetical protein